MATVTYLGRDDWEEPGYTIAAHTDAGAVDWSVVDNVTIHYPGGGIHPMSADVERARSYVADMQRDYVDNRNYSVGYNEIVTQSGIVVEARGAGTRCAANGVTLTNRTSYAIQIAATVGEPASGIAITAVRERIAWAEHRAGRTLAVTGHRDHRPTPCPGDEIYAQVIAGVFGPIAAPSPHDPAVVAGITNEVMWRHPDFTNIFLLGGDSVVEVSPAEFATHSARGVPLIVEARGDLLRLVLHQAGLDRSDLDLA